MACLSVSPANSLKSPTTPLPRIWQRGCHQAPVSEALQKYHDIKTLDFFDMSMSDCGSSDAPPLKVDLAVDWSRETLSGRLRLLMRPLLLATSNSFEFPFFSPLPAPRWHICCGSIVVPVVTAGQPSGGP